MKHFSALAVLILAAGGIAVWLLGDNLLLGMGLSALSLVVWALAPSTIGRVGTGYRTSSAVDARKVKQYRADHPGATIADAMRAMHR